jgi:hypothetical protein
MLRIDDEYFGGQMHMANIIFSLILGRSSLRGEFFL